VEQVFSELGGGTNSFGVTGNTQATLRLTADGSKYGTFITCRIYYSLKALLMYYA
jgi:hypothetical protein